MSNELHENVLIQARRIADEHSAPGWADTRIGGVVVYSTRLDAPVGGEWYSEGTYGFGANVVVLRAGRHYDVDEIVALIEGPGE